MSVSILAVCTYKFDDIRDVVCFVGHVELKAGRELL